MFNCVWGCRCECISVLGGNGERVCGYRCVYGECVGIGVCMVSVYGECVGIGVCMVSVCVEGGGGGWGLGERGG